MLEATCPRCGYHAVGWALLALRHRACPECGARLRITDERKPSHAAPATTTEEEVGPSEGDAQTPKTGAGDSA